MGLVAPNKPKRLSGGVIRSEQRLHQEAVIRARRALCFGEEIKVLKGEEKMTSYRHTADMGEISGFGGQYEECCQEMLEAGVKWLDGHKNPELEARTLRMGRKEGEEGVEVFGVFDVTTDDAKELEKAVMAVPMVEKYGATGAMHQAVMQRLFWIAKNGWGRYCQELRESSENDADRS